ncbi:hypothetical protein HHK36_022879 [Tetracentron sinense]|uniref:Classical arabinogalactan protein 26 n=1 Tax=Tetracentron sinense TaxID=13715 RepID=A0A834YNL6_TETSI|nr:hypothetical protein HHK36_022879 [Tetracentron sinense]
MASFWFLLPLFMAFTTSPSLSLSSHLHLETSTISAAPAFLPTSPLSSPPNLSPDITPLFPSPGGVLAPSPSGSSAMPTIPSNLSPPNPDEMVSPGPDSAISPSGSLPVSSSSSLDFAGFLNSAVLVSLLAYWVVQIFGI